MALNVHVEARLRLQSRLGGPFISSTSPKKTQNSNMTAVMSVLTPTLTYTRSTGAAGATHPSGLLSGAYVGLRWG